MGWHVTNLPACTLLTSQTSCSFLKRTRSLKKRTGRFHWKNKSFLKFDLLFFPITVSTCRNALFLLQIFQPFRKRPARRHSGWRICIVKCFSRKISFRKNDSLRIGGRSVRLKHSNPQLKDSWAQSFSRNAHRQRVCGEAEAFEGIFLSFFFVSRICWILLVFRNALVWANTLHPFGYIMQKKLINYTH